MKTLMPLIKYFLILIVLPVLAAAAYVLFYKLDALHNYAIIFKTQETQTVKQVRVEVPVLPQKNTASLKASQSNKPRLHDTPKTSKAPQFVIRQVSQKPSSPTRQTQSKQPAGSLNLDNSKQVTINDATTQQNINNIIFKIATSEISKVYTDLDNCRNWFDKIVMTIASANYTSTDSAALSKLPRYNKLSTRLDLTQSGNFALVNKNKSDVANTRLIVVDKSHSKLFCYIEAAKLLGAKKETCGILRTCVKDPATLISDAHFRYEVTNLDPSAK